MQRVLLIQFAKAPLPGRVKTRMSAVLNPQQACRLHSELVLWTTRRLTGAGLGPVELVVAGGGRWSLFLHCRALGVSAVRRQRGSGLGQRMYHALASGLARHDKVILVGSDCPQIDRDYLRAALDALQHSEVVLGPAADGGYVLIGARRVQRNWFTGVAWGTSMVYQQTVSRLERGGTRWQSLAELRDIDHPGDLALWQTQLAQAG